MGKLKNCVLVFLCLTIVRASWASNVVPFEIVNGLVIVEAELDGEVGNFIIDSGANEVRINRKPQNAADHFETVNGHIAAEETLIEELTIGNFSQKKLVGFATDLSSLEVILNKSLDGILSHSIFTPSRLIFDFELQTLTISDQKIASSEIDGFHELPYTVIDDVPVVSLLIGDIEYRFILDSGASSHFINTDLIQSNQLSAEKTGDKKTVYSAMGEGNTSLEYKINQPSVLDEHFYAYGKSLDMLSSEMGVRIDGLLSLRKLASKSKVFFDIHAKKVYF